jgi:positive regulator of sigma E activity
MKWWMFYPIYLAVMFLGMALLHLLKSTGQIWVIPFILVAFAFLFAFGYSWQARKEAK